MAKHHISWGGLSVRHLCLEDSVLEPALYCSRSTGNSKLHRFAQSDDCLHARKIVEGKDVNDIWNLVSKTNIEVAATVFRNVLKIKSHQHLSIRMSYFVTVSLQSGFWDKFQVIEH